MVSVYMLSWLKSTLFWLSDKSNISTMDWIEYNLTYFGLRNSSIADSIRFLRSYSIFLVLFLKSNSDYSDIVNIYSSLFNSSVNFSINDCEKLILFESNFSAMVFATNFFILSLPESLLSVEFIWLLLSWLFWLFFLPSLLLPP
jgi:hypothetical protein